MLERLLALFAGAALLTTGCIGSDPGDDAVTPTGAESPAVGTNESEPSLPTGEAPPPPVEPVVVPLAWDGSMSLHATLCEWENAGTCVMVPPGAELDNSHMPMLPGPPSAGTLTLTWEASSPLTEELVLVVMAMLETDEGMEHAFAFSAAGTSPVEVAFSDADVPPEAMVHLWVGPPSHLPDPLWGAATTEQAFHVEGTFTVVPVEGAAGMDHSAH